MESVFIAQPAYQHDVAILGRVRRRRQPKRPFFQGAFGISKETGESYALYLSELSFAGRRWGSFEDRRTRALRGWAGAP
jgi:hypothetical protein